MNVGGTGEFTTGNVTTLLSNLTTSINNNGLKAGSSIGFDTTNASGGTFTVADNIANSTGTGAGSLGVTKLGAGTLVLTAANTYTGATTISAGTLQLGNNLALQNSTLDTSGAGVVSLSAVTTPTFGGLAGSKSLASVITTGYSGVTSLTLNPGSGTSTYAGVIADGAAGMTLTKSGAGTQTLSGANTYPGATTISAGTLNLTNASGSATGTGAVTLDAGAFLTGTGALNAGANAITLNGTISVGDSTLGSPVASTLTLRTTSGSGITLGADGGMRFDLFSGAGLGDNTTIPTASDLFMLFGDISLLSGAKLYIDNPNNMTAWALGDQWRLWDVTNAGTRTGSFALANILGPALSGIQVWKFDSQSGILSIVPEPSRAMLLMLGLCGVLLRRRRK